MTMAGSCRAIAAPFKFKDGYAGGWGGVGVGGDGIVFLELPLPPHCAAPLCRLTVPPHCAASLCRLTVPPHCAATAAGAPIADPVGLEGSVSIDAPFDCGYFVSVRIAGQVRAGWLGAVPCLALPCPALPHGDAHRAAVAYTMEYIHTASLHARHVWGQRHRPTAWAGDLRSAQALTLNPMPSQAQLPLAV